MTRSTMITIWIVAHIAFPPLIVGISIFLSRKFPKFGGTSFRSRHRSSPPKEEGEE